MRRVLTAAITLIGASILCSAASAQSYSELWGRNGEKWRPGGRLPDFSFAGYDYRYHAAGNCQWRRGCKPAVDRHNHRIRICDRQAQYLVDLDRTQWFARCGHGIEDIEYFQHRLRTENIIRILMLSPWKGDQYGQSHGTQG